MERLRPTTDERGCLTVGSRSDDPIIDDGGEADRAMSTSGFALEKPTSAPSSLGNAALRSRAALAGADEVESPAIATSPHIGYLVCSA